MIRIAICCGEGFASGFLSRHLTGNTIRENLQDQVSFIFMTVYELYDRQDEVDIAMILPHMEPKFKSDKREYSIPIYIIPYKVVIKPPVRDYLEDAEDIIEMAKGKPGGLYHFPGEEFTVRVSRLTSYRRYMESQKNKKKK